MYASHSPQATKGALKDRSAFFHPACVRATTIQPPPPSCPCGEHEREKGRERERAREREGVRGREGDSPFKGTEVAASGVEGCVCVCFYKVERRAPVFMCFVLSLTAAHARFSLLPYSSLPGCCFAWLVLLGLIPMRSNHNTQANMSSSLLWQLMRKNNQFRHVNPSDGRAFSKVSVQRTLGKLK